MNYPVSGSCQCGRITYKLSKPPVAIAACHCKQCQKLSTSAFSLSAMVDSDALEISGDMSEWSRISENGNTSTAKFCPTCANHIYHYNPNNPSHLMLKPSTLSDTSIVNPTIHVWVSEKQSWYQIPEGVLVYETQP